VIANSVLPVDRVPIVSAAVPVFESVAVCAVLTEPTLRLPKAGGEVSVVVGAGAGEPLPVRLSTALPLLASETSVSVPLRVPTAAGVKVKVTVQVPPIASTVVGVQVPPRVKSPEVVPVSVSALKFNAAVPELLTVTDWLALGVPTTREAKVSDDALSEICGVGTAVPVPLSVIVDGEPVALCAMLSVPARAPVAVGRKVICNVQEALAATVPPAVQVEAPVFWNSAAWAPPSVSVLMVRGPVPVLLTVTVWAVDVVLMT
jgi:hypothetical protein